MVRRALWSDALLPLPALTLRTLDSPPHERTPIVLLGPKLVVRAAEHMDVRRRRQPPLAERLLVVQLEEAALLAALAVGADVAASCPVPCEHLAADRVRDVPTISLGRGSRAASARPVAAGEGL